MSSDTDDYVAYLLRMWREDMNGERSWRAALRDALTLEERHFANVEALIGFLHEEYSHSSADPAARGQQFVDE